MEAGGNDPHARQEVVDIVARLVSEGLLEERGSDFYALTMKGRAASVENLTDTLLTIAVLGGILIRSAFVTRLFARKMYYQCGECGNLNAKRRTHCRICGSELAF